MERHNREREWEDYRFGMLASVIANIYRDRKARPQPFTPQDFMPRQPPSAQDLLMKVEMLNAAFGGEDRRKGAH